MTPTLYENKIRLKGIQKIRAQLRVSTNFWTVPRKYQSGFLPNRSTTFQLIDIYHHICQTFDNNQFSCIVFCDVSKAFDRVWHKGLIFKLKQVGIEWINDYLSNRQQKVVIKNCSSSLRRVNAGVPQGSVLRPLLFLVYANDISESLLSLTRLYADDSSLFYSTASFIDIQDIINHDLRILVRWAAQWLIDFNPLKTQAILFDLRLLDHLPQLTFDSTPIKFVFEHKHLGLTLNSNGQWHSHIENIITSACKVLGIMRKLKFNFSRIALNQIFVSYILTVLEYSCIVWDSCTVQDVNALEKVQNEAQDQDQDSLLVKRRNDNHSPGPVIRELVPSSHQRSELSNTILCIFSGWDQRIGEGIPIPDSLGEEATFINICIGNGSLKCHKVLIPTTPSFGDKVICWYTGFTFKTFI